MANPVKRVTLTRRDYRQSRFADLPFVQDIKVSPRETRRRCWSVPQTEDYGAACTAGRQYASDFVQFLHDRPELHGSNLIGLIVKDMGFHQESAMKGYEVGFWCALEILLTQAAAKMDHLGQLQRDQDRHDYLAARSQAREEAA